MSVQLTIWEVIQMTPGEFVAYGCRADQAYFTCELELA